jgi:hypothetical protein
MIPGHEYSETSNKLLVAQRHHHSLDDLSPPGIFVTAVCSEDVSVDAP